MQLEKEAARAQETPAPGSAVRSDASGTGKGTSATVLPSGRARPPTPPEPKKRRKS